PADYGAIVGGRGDNGLGAAAYLARSGARTLVLEARPKTGGAATTEAPWPDAPEFRVTRLSYVMSLLPPTIINDLQLHKHGYKIFPMGPYYQAFPEGGSIKLYADDAKRNHDEVSKWSKKDADAMPRWDAWLAGLADVLGPLLLTVPPNLGSRKPRDLNETLRLAWRQRGLDVRTVARVSRLLLSDGRAAGVELENGQQLTAKVVVSSLHPRTAFLDHVGRANLPDDFVTDIEHWKTRSGVVKINLALAELPDFTADPGTSLAEHHTGSVEMAPTMPYIERAFLDAREGRPASRPFSDGVIP